MALFWIVHEINGKRYVFLGEGSALTFARLRATMVGLDRGFVEAHALDALRARKVPRRLIGRVLTPHTASRLLDRMFDRRGRERI